MENVLGRFDHHAAMMNCIGVDYQPPTPAPANHHIIGEDDDVTPAAPGRPQPIPVNPATALYGGGQVPGNHQNIPNFPNPVKRNSGPPSMPKPPPRQQQNITQVCKKIFYSAINPI